MNKEKILALADLIEGLPDDKFNMENCTFDAYDEVKKQYCGSPSCIAGWAAWLQQGRPEYVVDNRGVWSQRTNTLVNSALEYFGIPLDSFDADRVMNHLFRGNYDAEENESLTKDDAVAALHYFAETGNITWPDLDGDY